MALNAEKKLFFHAMDWLALAAGYNELFICLISSDDMKGIPLPMSIKQTDMEFTSATTITSAICCRR
ncbi:Os09g0356300 [Oryza sativa Japonica Group]|uniref:Os09g0356300 protein n=1 Tax=Oryza sativa subsp. japonica TaxID=39947 RepID=A0A0P0XKL4_ORYSJ|nr:hypothetical protein EE612_047241 [Oryza sativa]BAT07670.1 Os09g0356300 [Oryza sativa Japonica Group]